MNTITSWVTNAASSAYQCVKACPKAIVVLLLGSALGGVSNEYSSAITTAAIGAATLATVIATHIYADLSDKLASSGQPAEGAKAAITAAINTIPFAKKALVIKKALEWTNPAMDHRDIITIIKALGRFSRAELQSKAVDNAGFFLGEGCCFTEGRSKFFTTLRSFSIDVSAELLARAIALTPESIFTPSEVDLVFHSCCSISFEEQAECFAEALPLLSLVPNDYQEPATLKLLSRLYSNDRAEIDLIALPSAARKTILGMGKFVHILGTIEKNERANVAALIKCFSPYLLNEDQLIRFIVAFRNIDDSKRASVVENVLRLLELKIAGSDAVAKDDIPYLIEKLGTIPTNRLGNLVTKMTPLLSSNMKADDVFQLIRSLNEVPLYQLDSLISRVNRFLSGFGVLRVEQLGFGAIFSLLLEKKKIPTGVDSKLTLIFALKNIPQDKWEFFLSKVALFCKEGMADAEMAAIIETLSKIQLDEINQIIELAFSPAIFYNSQEMEWESIKNRLDYIVSLLIERRNFAELLSRYLTLGMSQKDWDKFTVYLESIGDADRHQVLELGLQLVTPEMGADPKRSVLESIVNIPTHTREASVQRVVSHLAEHQRAFNRLNPIKQSSLISELLETPLDRELPPLLAGTAVIAG